MIITLPKVLELIKAIKHLLVGLILYCLVVPFASAVTFTLLTEELPPYSIQKEGKATGIAVEIVTELFERANLPFTVKVVPWQRAYNGALYNANTCIFPIQRNQERETQFQWVSPILITQNGFYTLDSFAKKIRTIDDVKGLKIGSYRGSGVAEYLLNNGYEVAIVTKDILNFKKLLAGRIDVWATDTRVSQYLINQKSVKNISEQLIYFSSLRALGCNLETSPDTINKLQATLKEMYADGSVNAIMEQLH